MKNARAILNAYGKEMLLYIDKLWVVISKNNAQFDVSESFGEYNYKSVLIHYWVSTSEEINFK